MFFLSPSALAKAGEFSKSSGINVNPFASMRWLAFGVTLRDEGIALSYQVPMDANTVPGLTNLGQIAPLDPQILKKLPAGAYSVMAYSQPGTYWNFAQDMVANDPDTKKKMDEGVAEFEKQTGISVPNDILPALKGRLTLALYPDARGTEYGVDGVFIADDANGANPAALAEKLRALVERETSKDGKRGVHFTTTTRNGATCYALDPESREQMHQSLLESFGGRPRTRPVPAASPNPDGEGSVQTSPVPPAASDDAPETPNSPSQDAPETPNENTETPTNVPSPRPHPSREIRRSLSRTKSSSSRRSATRSSSPRRRECWTKRLTLTRGTGVRLRTSLPTRTWRRR